jgi:enoyl-[acyl-carrier protein] reductase I
MGFLQDKRALIVGVASNRSIAYGVAAAMHREGAQLAFTYPGEKLRDRVAKFAAEFDSDIVLPLDVSSDDEIDAVFAELGERWDGLDCLIHSVGFAPREQLEGSYIDAVTREGFRIAHDISAVG